MLFSQAGGQTTYAHLHTSLLGQSTDFFCRWEGWDRRSAEYGANTIIYLLDFTAESRRWIIIIVS